MNGQIEYLLTECVKYRKKHQKEEYGGEGMLVVTIEEIPGTDLL